jgi:hypothetical protein
MELREFVVFISGPYSGDSDDSINYHIARATILSDEVWKMGMTLKEACNLLGYDSQEISNVLYDSDNETVNKLRNIFGM